jgi:serine/threonine-protein kinase HipA
MRKAIVRVNREAAGYLVQETTEGTFTFEYVSAYRGVPVSLTMPVREEPYLFERFPPFFDGLLPEGHQLEALLRAHKLDRTDYMGQILRVGTDLVGNVTVEEST